MHVCECASVHVSACLEVSLSIHHSLAIFHFSLYIVHLFSFASRNPLCLPQPFSLCVYIFSFSDISLSLSLFSLSLSLYPFLSFSLSLSLPFSLFLSISLSLYPFSFSACLSRVSSEEQCFLSHHLLSFLLACIVSYLSRPSPFSAS